MTSWLIPEGVPEQHHKGILWALLAGIACVLIGVLSKTLVVLLPFLVILYYLASSAPRIGVYLLLISFPISTPVFISAISTEIQFPTEPLLGLVFVAWLVKVCVFSDPVPLNAAVKPIRLALWLFFLALSMSVITSTYPVVTAKLTIVTAFYASAMIFMLNREFHTVDMVLGSLRLLFWITLLLCVYTLVNHASLGFSAFAVNIVMLPFYEEHGTYAAFITITFGIAAVLAIEPSRIPGLRLLSSAVASVSLIAIFFSQTRASWVSVLGVIAFIMLFKFRNLFNLKLLLAGAAIGLLIGMFLTRFDIQDEIQKTMSSMTDIERNVSNLERINRWVAAANMIKSKPWTGVGYGTYPINYYEYRDPLFRTEISEMFAQAHNEYLQLWAETGLFGLIAWLSLFYFLFRNGIRAYKTISDPDVAHILLGSMAGVLSYLIHAFFNGFLLMDKVAVPFWYTVGLIYLILNRHQTLEQSTKRITTE